MLAFPECIHDSDCAEATTWTFIIISYVKLILKFICQYCMFIDCTDKVQNHSRYKII